MRKINPPTDNVADVYLLCISSVDDPSLKSMLAGIETEIAVAGDDYREHGVAGTFFEIAAHNAVGGVSREQLEDVYTARMARRRAPGRPIYDKLKAAAPFARCPSCGQGHVKTLDHYLPKSLYPALTVTPLNLVPACADCNKAKLDVVPTSAGQQPLHPYFDDVEGARWLYAEVIEGSPPAVRYFINSPGQWGPVRAERLVHHFKTYRLAELYASYSGEELVNIREVAKIMMPTAGVDGVRGYLEIEREKYEARHLNSWQSALYRATSQNDWFWQGGFAA